MWRQSSAQAVMTPLLFASIAKSLQALNVRSTRRRRCRGSDSLGLDQVAGQGHPRWQAKCSVLQHVSATATSGKDVYLVSLSGDANDAGYIVLRCVRKNAAFCASRCAKARAAHRLQS